MNTFINIVFTILLIIFFISVVWLIWMENPIVEKILLTDLVLILMMMLYNLLKNKNQK